jgi:hypothetical protein
MNPASDARQRDTAGRQKGKDAKRVRVFVFQGLGN